MKFKNKFLLLIILVFAFLIFFNISNVKATTYDLTTISYINNGANWAFADCTTSQGKNLLFVCREHTKGYNYLIYNKKSRDGCLAATKNNYSNASSGDLYVYSLNSDGSISFIGSTGSEGSNDYIIDKVIYSSTDIYYLDNKGTSLFFQQTPKETVTSIYLSELTPLLKVEEMEKTNLQIRVIIPLIIVVVVSFLGLRKALQMLSTILRRS